jgi:hypothetical protein
MDCEKFETLLIDELYGELDEVTSAAVRRHAAGCARCGALLSGLRATRKVAALPVEEASADLEDRILSAVREQQKVVPFRVKLATVVSRAGAWAMRPQTAMAAVFLLVIGTSFVFMKQGRHADAPEGAMQVQAAGAPAARAAATTVSAASAIAIDGVETRSAHGVEEQEGRGVGHATANAELAAADERTARDKDGLNDLEKKESKPGDAPLALNAGPMGGAPAAPMASPDTASVYGGTGTSATKGGGSGGGGAWASVKPCSRTTRAATTMRSRSSTSSAPPMPTPRCGRRAPCAPARGAPLRCLASSK